MDRHFAEWNDPVRSLCQNKLLIMAATDDKAGAIER